jgi:hypothetical protein
MTNLDPTRLDALVHARRAAATSPPSELELARALRAFAPPSYDDTRWLAEIRESLVRARSDDTATMRRFGVSGDVDWKRLHERIVPGLSLGIAADDARTLSRLKDRDHWAAAIVARARGLWSDGAPPSLATVCDRLVWRSLHLAGNAKRTPPEIRAHFMRALLPTASGPPEKLVRLLAAHDAGASRTDLRSLREALVRRWLCAQTWDTPPTFATAVRDAADRATDGTFGGRKVFISTVWRGVREQPAFRDLSLEQFKRELVAAHKAGLVSLARADLTAAMDAAAVRESETTHLEARYHFVERERTP